MTRGRWSCRRQGWPSPSCLDPTAPGFAHAAGGFPWWFLPVVVLVVVCVFGLWLFNHEAPRIAERL